MTKYRCMLANQLQFQWFRYNLRLNLVEMLIFLSVIDSNTKDTLNYLFPKFFFFFFMNKLTANTFISCYQFLHMNTADIKFHIQFLWKLVNVLGYHFHENLKIEFWIKLFYWRYSFFFLSIIIWYICFPVKN